MPKSSSFSTFVTSRAVFCAPGTLRNRPHAFADRDVRLRQSQDGRPLVHVEPRQLADDLGDHLMAVAPVPITATRLPVRS
jgi:hypothetical protein